MLTRLMCVTVGHDLIRKQEGRRTYGVCIRCGAETLGWTYGESPAETTGSQAYWDAVYEDFMDTELALHGGG